MSQGLQMNIQIGKKYLVTADNWFYTPDGRQARAIFGTVHSIVNAEQTLGIKVNARSTDWFLQIGNLTIAGCQIHYAIQTETCNPSKSVADWQASAEAGFVEYQRPNVIYFADEPFSGLEAA